MFLALLVLSGTLGVTLHKHYCGSMLVATSVATEAQCCDMDSEGGDCCENESERFVVESEFQMQLAVESPELLLADIVEIALVDEGLDTESAEFNSNYKYPPPIASDIIVDVQSFLL